MHSDTCLRPGMGQTLDVHWGQIQREAKESRIPGKFI